MRIVFSSCYPLVVLLALVSCGGGGARSSASSQASSEPVAHHPLNDTGVGECASEQAITQLTAFGCVGARQLRQDAEVGRDFAAFTGELDKRGAGEAGFDFIKLNVVGDPLDDQSLQWRDEGSELANTQWSCVHDARTGLTWEVKQPATDHLRYAGNTYSWFNEQLAGIAQGTADAGDCNHAVCDTAGYLKAVNDSALCGYQDWRLPSVTEFLSIGHFGRSDPAIDVSLFPNTFGLRHWTSQTYVEVPLLAWYMYFSDGSISYTGKGDPSYLRLVRGGNASD